jgi:uncharacterized protein (TIGR02001 family)
MTTRRELRGERYIFNVKGNSMRYSQTKSSIFGLAAILMASASVPAFAQDAEEEASPITISGSAAITSDYRFRGLSQSDGNFAVQGSIGASHESGFYVGTWGSSISFAGGTEIDLYGGWKGEVASGLTVDAGLMYYLYPNAGSSFAPVASDFFEPYASVSGTIGPVGAKVGVAYAFGGQSALNDEDNIYVYSDLTAAIPDTPVTLNAHLGYSKGDSALSTLQLNDNDYIDWSIGADYAVAKNLTLGLKYSDTDDAPAVQDFSDSAVFVTLGVAF